MDPTPEKEDALTIWCYKYLVVWLSLDHVSHWSRGVGAAKGSAHTPMRSDSEEGWGLHNNYEMLIIYEMLTMGHARVFNYFYLTMARNHAFCFQERCLRNSKDHKMRSHIALAPGYASMLQVSLVSSWIIIRIHLLLFY